MLMKPQRKLCLLEESWWVGVGVERPEDRVPGPEQRLSHAEELRHLKICSGPSAPSLRGVELQSPAKARNRGGGYGYYSRAFPH